MLGCIRHGVALLATSSDDCVLFARGSWCFGDDYVVSRYVISGFQ